MTTLYRWRADLPLGKALAAMPAATVVAEHYTKRPTIGRWEPDPGEIVDVIPGPPRDGRATGELRRRAVAALLADGAYALRAFTPDVELRWRDDRAVWLAESAVPEDATATPVAVRLPRNLLRHGQPLTAADPIPGWTPWGDAKVGVLWYPIDAATVSGEVVPVLRVVHYAAEVSHGPAAGCVHHLATRWTAWQALAHEEVTLRSVSTPAATPSC